MLLLLLVVAPLAAAFTIIIAVVRVSRLVVGAWTSVPVPLASLHELEALSILHRRSILYHGKTNLKSALNQVAMLKENLP